MNRPNYIEHLRYPIRHLMEDDIEEVCLSQPAGAAEDWREDHLLLCPDCLEKAERVLDRVRGLRTALRSCGEPGRARYAAPLLSGMSMPKSRYVM